MYIGIDVGGTNLKAGLVDEAGHILVTEKTPLGTFPGAEGFAQKLAELAAAVMKKGGAAREEVSYVGIGIPGAVADGVILYTANIPMEHVPIEALFRQHLDLPVLLGNDADCAAVGEWVCGAGRGTRDFLVLTLGTGIGGGLILGGRLYAGQGAGGEVGHMVVEKDGAPCNCGRRGCWEQYSSASALKRLTREEKFVVEAGSCTTVAAVMDNRERIGGKQIALVLSGGNIDGQMLLSLLEKYQ